MNALLISDLHLTSNPRDEYRWRLFDWLLEAIPAHDVKMLYILGDLTDAKDYHSAKLVNRIVDNLTNVFRKTPVTYITVLQGNHDGNDPKLPYFKFLNRIPSIRFVSEPTLFEESNINLVLLPHTRKPAVDWPANMELIRSADVIFAHATFAGAQVENGVIMREGTPLSLLKDCTPLIYSGDVHVPQRLGTVTYIGSPYPVRFGDSFEGRALLLKDMGDPVSLPISNIQRVMIIVTPADRIVKWPREMHKGDQVKVRIRLQQHEMVDWDKVKRNVMAACAKLEVELCGIELDRAPQRQRLVRRSSPQAAAPQNEHHLFSAYCKDHNISSHLEEVGAFLLSDVPRA